jgi:hypothetical protein
VSRIKRSRTGLLIRNGEDFLYPFKAPAAAGASASSLPASTPPATGGSGRPPSDSKALQRSKDHQSAHWRASAQLHRRTRPHAAIVTTVRTRHVKGAYGVAHAMAQAPPLTQRPRPRIPARYEDEPSE